MEVLIEGHARKGEGRLMGRTSCFRKVSFLGNPSQIGEVRNVKIQTVTPTSLHGELI